MKEENKHSLRVKARSADKVGASTAAVRAGKEAKEGQSPASERTSHEWHVKTPIYMMHNRYMTENDGRNFDSQEVYVRLSLVADSLWSAIMEEKPGSYERVAKTRHWYGAFDEGWPEHYIASRILTQQVIDTGEVVTRRLPTLKDCTEAASGLLQGGAPVGNTPLAFYQHPDTKEKYDVRGACIEREGEKVKLEGFGQAAAIALVVGSVDLHANNFVVRDDGKRILLSKIDNKYDLGGGQGLGEQMDFSFFKVPISRSPEEFDKESARLKKALEQAKEEVHFITLKPETLSEEELEKRARLISENPYNKLRSINNAIKRLGQEKADILKPMTEQGDLGKTLGHIFLTPDNIDESLEAQGGRYVFKFPFEQGFATAEHVQDEFLSTLHVFTHIAPEKIPYLTESIMGNEFISPVTGRPVSAMVGQQLVANIQNIAMALEHCPEYQTFVSAHREELEAKTAMAEEILAFAAKSQAIETPKGKHSFVGQLEAKKTQGRKRDSISNSSNSSLGFTTDSEGSTLGSEGITMDSESETSHSGSRWNSSYMEEEKIRRSGKNKEDRSL